MKHAYLDYGIASVRILASNSVATMLFTGILTTDILRRMAAPVCKMVDPTCSGIVAHTGRLVIALADNDWRAIRSAGTVFAGPAAFVVAAGGAVSRAFSGPIRRGAPAGPVAAGVVRATSGAGDGS